MTKPYASPEDKGGNIKERGELTRIVMNKNPLEENKSLKYSSFSLAVL